jgi:hypothetical protein
MANNDRKYGVVIAHQDYVVVKKLLDVVLESGASVKDIGVDVVGANQEFYCHEWESGDGMAALSDVVYDLDLFIMHTKWNAIRWLRGMSDSIDLVLMDFKGTQPRPWVDGFEASRYMDEHGYENWVAVHHPQADENFEQMAKASGIDEVIHLDMKPGEMIDYIVARYQIDRSATKDSL